MMDEAEKKKLRKRAHVKALARLAHIHSFEYVLHTFQAKAEVPSLTPSGVVAYAHSRLREAFPHEFHDLYNEEKIALGLPRRERDFKALAKEIVRLSDDATGMNRKQIARRLGVSYQYVNKKLRAQKKLEEEGTDEREEA